MNAAAMRIEIEIDQCDDEQTWVWSLHSCGNQLCYGYSGSKAEACEDARAARRHEYAWRNGDES